LNIDKQALAAMLKNDRYPRSAKYDPKWVVKGWMGPNVLWLTEWLCEKMDLRPGMRVLDMGCGKALSSVFMAKEFGVKVWANDLWISATENWQSILQAGCGESVYPVHAEAHSLPYADGFFDAIVSLDSYTYYGTDDMYMSYFHKFVKPGGKIGIVVPGLTREIEGQPPRYLTDKGENGRAFWVDECWSFHTSEWWQRHWDRMTVLNDVAADLLPDGWKDWAQFDRACNAAGTLIFPPEAPTLEEDAGRYIGLVRVVARRIGE
jgi:SAM-dependent methyltransferase